MGGTVRCPAVPLRLLVALALPFAALGCGRGEEPAAEARLAQALEAMQQGRPDDAMRALAAIPPSGGWLRAATYTAPLALRLRADLSVRAASPDEVRRLLGEYEERYASFAAAAYVRQRRAFFERFKDWQGVPALLYLRGAEAESENPGLAIREWRALLRDYPHAAIAPAARLRLGLLQQRLENPSWALADLMDAAQAPPEAVDDAGQPVAARAWLAIGQVHRDLRHDAAAAREAFGRVLADHGGAIFRAWEGSIECGAAVLAEFELASLAANGDPERLERLAREASPRGYVTPGRIGDARLEARLALAELALRARAWERAGARALEALRQAGDALVGAPAGPRRGYGFEVVDWLEGRLGGRAPAAAVEALREAAERAPSRPVWALAQLARVRLLARLGRPADARAVALELERRFPNLECVVPAREARRVVGG
jgi:tetratricopeptide (TPR) repeat protein